MAMHMSLLNSDSFKAHQNHLALQAHSLATFHLVDDPATLEKREPPEKQGKLQNTMSFSNLLMKSGLTVAVRDAQAAVLMTATRQGHTIRGKPPGVARSLEQRIRGKLM